MSEPGPHGTAGGAEAPAAEGRRGGLVFALPAAAFVALAGIFLARLFLASDPSIVPSVLVGRAPPAFALPAVQGLVAQGLAAPAAPVPGLSSADLGGRVTVVNVWASWCEGCQVEHPVLMGLAAEAGLRLVGIDYKDTAENARRFLGRHGNPYAAVGFDATGRTAIDWGVYGAPETFIVGPDGTVRYRHVGGLTPEGLPAFLARVRAAGAGS